VFIRRGLGFLTVAEQLDIAGSRAEKVTLGADIDLEALVVWHPVSLRALRRGIVKLREVEQAVERRFEVADRLRVKAVIDPASIAVFPPLQEQPGPTQYPEMMTCHTLRDTKSAFEVADAELPLGEKADDAETRLVSQDFQEFW
jgi:hypothetical protein